MPEGLRDKDKRDPLNLSSGEWQQAKRRGVDPREVKSLFQEAWKHSDNLSSFQHARDKFRRGIMGLFDKVTGRAKRLHLINKKIIGQVKRKQVESRKRIVFRHNLERRVLQRDIIALRTRQHEERKLLAKRIHQMRKSERVQNREELSRDFDHAVLNQEKERSPEHSRKRSQETEKAVRTRHRKLDK